MYIFFFCKQKTAYEMRISDWSSDVCSSDLNSEVLIVTDIKRGDLAALSGAYSRLIEAAGGGTRGLFTAIQRLKSVYARIADPLARAGLPLYAQHVDPSSEEHTSELQSQMRSSYAVFCLKTKQHMHESDVQTY